MSESLWHFALWLYRQPDVEDLCLELQDRHGADVPLLLCYAWLDSRGQALAPALHEHLEREATRWQNEIISPLREARRAMKRETDIEPLRERVKACELEAEKALLERFESLVSHAQTLAAPDHSLCHQYLNQLGVNGDKQQTSLALLQKTDEFRV
ncbi:TIGR02444 family protein [Gilvimarinus xylanilyticus]|uniref:TIGR02444 family protein n=1 Tax=Gilvimarinus xylanilyticus TaxID=2944139 RepID=A0A9X2I482_9GAMM|nr:TIGR02444 family protein [Gilvimarinus xylanilyticus]MCP8900458.1 TIGR02444 family protein [Gilvimarinus xylanilyticus]